MNISCSKHALLRCAIGEKRDNINLVYSRYFESVENRDVMLQSNWILFGLSFNICCKLIFTTADSDCVPISTKFRSKRDDVRETQCPGGNDVRQWQVQERMVTVKHYCQQMQVPISWFYRFLDVYIGGVSLSVCSAIAATRMLMMISMETSNFDMLCADI